MRISQETPRSMPGPDVSVVIVSWNVCDLLRDCLRSIQTETKSIHEIIVVDNASEDGSAAMMRSEFPEVRLVANEENLGFAAANNQAMRLARGRFLLLLNPDTVILDGAIDRLVSIAEQRPHLGCLGPQIWENQNHIQNTCFSFPSPVTILFSLIHVDRLFSRSRLFGHHFLGWWDRKTEREVDVVSGMAMLVPRSVLEIVGFMDEDYFVYAEEADWCHRMHQAGLARIFTPEARILHRGGGGHSTAQVSVKMYVQAQKSLLQFLRKRRGRVAYALSKFTYLIMMGARSLACLPLSLWHSASKARCARSLAALRFHLTGRMPS